MTECGICVEKYNKSNRVKIGCQYCESEACRECLTRWVLSDAVPRCMNNACNKEWDRKFMASVFTGVFINNDYKNVTLANIYGAGYPTNALSLLSDINESDYRNLDTLILLAVGNEQIGELSKAISYRKQIEKYDPWNAENLLALGLIYKKLNDSQNMDLTLVKILKFASSDPIATKAKEQLIPLQIIQ